MPVLVIRSAGAELCRRQLVGEVSIGRVGVKSTRPPADICVDDPLVSGKHVLFFLREDGLPCLRDLDSRNGTFLNGVKVNEAVLRVGDEVKIGSTTVAFVDDAPPLEYSGPIPFSSAGELLATTSTLRLDLREIREAGIAGARRDHQGDRLSLVWHAGEQLNRLSSREAILSAARDLLGRAFAQARPFVLLSADGGATWSAIDDRSDGPRRPPSASVTSDAVASRSAVLYGDLRRDVRFSGAESVIAGGIESAMAAPILRGERAVAVAYVDRLGGAPFDESDLRLFGLIANQVSAVLENASLVEELRRANADIERKVEERTAEVRRQAAEIAGLAAEKDELLGIAAHDIRGPLTTILGFLELARVKLHSSDLVALGEDLGVIEEAARGMGDLLTDLLDLKKVEAGKIRLDSSCFDASDYLAQASALGAIQARQRRIDLKLQSEPGLTIVGDRKRLGQALQNLLGNAVKFSQPGGSVTVEARRVGDEVEVSVTDTGPGIHADELRSLFRAYVQGEAGKRVAGTGLGLAIAQKLIELHKGRIWADSAPGRGSRFAFRLPFRPS